MFLKLKSVASTFKSLKKYNGGTDTIVAYCWYLSVSMNNYCQFKVLDAHERWILSKKGTLLSTDTLLRCPRYKTWLTFLDTCVQNITKPRLRWCRYSKYSHTWLKEVCCWWGWCWYTKQFYIDWLPLHAGSWVVHLCFHFPLKPRPPHEGDRHVACCVMIGFWRNCANQRPNSRFQLPPTVVAITFEGFLLTWPVDLIHGAPSGLLRITIRRNFV